VSADFYKNPGEVSKQLGQAAQNKRDTEETPVLFGTDNGAVQKFAGERYDLRNLGINSPFAVRLREDPQMQQRTYAFMDQLSRGFPEGGPIPPQALMAPPPGAVQ